MSSETSHLIEVYQVSPEVYESPAPHEHLEYLLKVERGSNLVDHGDGTIDLTTLVEEFPEAAPLLTSGWTEAQYLAQVVSYGRTALDSFIWGWQAHGDAIDSRESDLVADAQEHANNVGLKEVGFISSLLVTASMFKPLARFKNMMNEYDYPKGPYAYAITRNFDDERVAMTTKTYHQDTADIGVSPDPEIRQMLGRHAEISKSSALSDNEWKKLKALQDAMDAYFVGALKEHKIS